MNPSAHGWINKLLFVENFSTSLSTIATDDFYKELRRNGFIYGSNVSVFKDYVVNTDFTSEEICKVNLITAFNYIHSTTITSSSFVDSIIDFYTHINAYKASFFSELLGGKKNVSTLEKILHKRVQIDDNLIERSFNYFITNALLFTDILAYKMYLKTEQISEVYLKNLEAAIETVVIQTLNSKILKSDYDESLIDLFEQSRRYHDTKKMAYNEALSYITEPLEKFYLLDIACMAAWGDTIIDKKEYDFLNKLSEDLDLEVTNTDEATSAINVFYKKHKNKIALLSSKNVVKTFYNNSSEMVTKLISRNSKRLVKELQESKDLMKLLTQSTIRELNEDEQKRVNNQLLDVFKSIPSLAIFLLPGGALLLPIVIKFIPKLLPSAFDDNRVDN
ncbi:LETM1-like protein [Bizionia echini]|uniref:LETM1-like protein n=1 Tax=Bizionia echini TaxID=649333 RepID=A0A1I5BK83_9FLAO|nr:LETM1-related biofilm-associated protein [Bizionia echini]SFN74891.1 LETM1-like protein [Bizionia echini]